jgi:hypothetical protein
MGYSLQQFDRKNKITEAYINLEKLKDQVKMLQDLKRQHQISTFRFYTSDSQAILLELIAKEIEEWPEDKSIPMDLFLDLSNSKELVTNSIENLCILYRKVIQLSFVIQRK